MFLHSWARAKSTWKEINLCAYIVNNECTLWLIVATLIVFLFYLFWPSGLFIRRWELSPVTSNDRFTRLCRIRPQRPWETTRPTIRNIGWGGKSFDGHKLEQRSTCDNVTPTVRFFIVIDLISNRLVHKKTKSPASHFFCLIFLSTQARPRFQLHQNHQYPPTYLSTIKVDSTMFDRQPGKTWNRGAKWIFLF